MASYCNAGDTFCDSGNSIDVHLAYIQTNGQEATTFILSKVQGAATPKRHR
jgi:acetylxylan esterase